MNEIVLFIVIWLPWVVLIVLIDYFKTSIKVLAVLIHFYKNKVRKPKNKRFLLPFISIVIPAHNEEKGIQRCLNTLIKQKYPQESYEIIIVDDGSRDKTATRVTRWKALHNKKMTVHLETYVVNQGKAHALTLGIEKAKGKYIICLDADVVLAKDALLNSVLYFENNPEIDAATGNIEIAWNHDHELIASIKTKAIPRFLAIGQFFEYTNAYALGRYFQSLNNSIFTLSGAFSMMRKEVFEQVTYPNDTLAEDMDITWQLHMLGKKIGYIHNALVYVDPIISLDELYSQRVRWRQGQLQVSGKYCKEIVKKCPIRGRRLLSFRLFTDHTAGFARLLWIPMILLFIQVDLYSFVTVVYAVLLMYVSYILLEGLRVIGMYAISQSSTKVVIREYFWMLITVPFYRFIAYFFRLSGYLRVYIDGKSAWERTGPIIRFVERGHILKKAMAFGIPLVIISTFAFEHFVIGKY
ncbi:MAG: glycosyltransferase family 2 protein [bacterium]